MKKEKGWSKQQLAAFALFCAYMAFLLYFLFFAELTGRTYIDTTYHYNLIPFKEINRYIKYKDTIGTFAVFLNLEGNVLAFIPYGLLLPVLFKKCRSFPYVLLLSAEFSLLVELLQLISRVGSCDVDDLMLNTLGGVIGYGIYRLCCYFHQKKSGSEKQDSCRGADKGSVEK